MKRTSKYLPFENNKIVEQQIHFLDQSDFYQYGQSIIYRLLIIYGFKEKIIINFKLHDFDIRKGILYVNSNGESGINIDLPESIYQDLVKYCALNKYVDRANLFTKSNGTLLTPDSMLGTLQSRLKKIGITNFTPTTVALQGVSHLIEKGLSLVEIMLLTGFETQKIRDVSFYLLSGENVEEMINKKLG